jgi:signal transduction histidine kinase
MATSQPHLSYRAFLASRWPARTRGLALHAFAGTFALALLDGLYAHVLSLPVDAAAIAAARLPWALLPVLGWLALAVAPASRFLAPVVVGLSLAWCWGNSWAYLALGLEGTVLHAVARLAWLVTAATFLPLSGSGRGILFLFVWLAHPVLSLFHPPATMGVWLATEVVVVAFGLIQLLVFQNYAGSQRRGVLLRGRLERAVVALDTSRRQAASAVAEVGRLASTVAHDVNNPLSAVKVNVRWLGGDAASAESAEDRAEVVSDTLAAVDRIARIVADLKQRAAEQDESVQRSEPADEDTTAIRLLTRDGESR